MNKNNDDSLKNFMPHNSTININYQHKPKRKNTYLHKGKKHERKLKLQQKIDNYRKGERIKSKIKPKVEKHPLATWQIRQMNLARITITSIGIIFIIIGWFLIATIWSFLLFSFLILLLLFWFDIKVVNPKFINNHL